jgi:hypothetical protein
VQIWLRMTYYCCGIEWTDDWPQEFKFECPDCGMLIEAHSIIEIEPPSTGNHR